MVKANFKDKKVAVVISSECYEKLLPKEKDNFYLTEEVSTHTVELDIKGGFYFKPKIEEKTPDDITKQVANVINDAVKKSEISIVDNITEPPIVDETPTEGEVVEGGN